MRAETYDLAILKFLAVNSEPYQRAFTVPPHHTGCAGIDMKQLERLVILHLQYVRMPSYKEIRR